MSEYRKCSCEWCERDTNNWKHNFLKYNNKWYCNKHYIQLKRNGELKKDKICNVGINDMPYGWTKENEWNNKIYQKWGDMIIRCYSEKVQEKYPTYKDCTVCDRWLYLSNFVNDFKLIKGYNEEKFLNGELCLDKDIKSNGTIKEYSLENCMLVSAVENTIQSHKTRDYNKISGNNNSNSVSVVQLSKNGEYIKTYDYATLASKEIEADLSQIIKSCRGKCKTVKGFKFMYLENYELYQKLNEYQKFDEEHIK